MFRRLVPLLVIVSVTAASIYAVVSLAPSRSSHQSTRQKATRSNGSNTPLNPVVAGRGGLERIFSKRLNTANAPSGFTRALKSSRKATPSRASQSRWKTNSPVRPAKNFQPPS